MFDLNGEVDQVRVTSFFLCSFERVQKKKRIHWASLETSFLVKPTLLFTNTLFYQQSGANFIQPPRLCHQLKLGGNTAHNETGSAGFPPPHCKNLAHNTVTGGDWVATPNSAAHH